MAKERRLDGLVALSCAASAALFLSYCAPSLPPLTLDAVSPSFGSQAATTHVAIFGSFYSPVASDLASGQQRVLDEFDVTLGSVPLAGVSLNTSSTLEAEIPPWLPPGPHSLFVEDALGRRAELRDAFHVVAPDAVGPEVQILEPGNDSHVMARASFTAQYRAAEPHLGSITRIDWIVSGGADLLGVRHIEGSVPLVEGSFVVDVPYRPRKRRIVVEVIAWDDAPAPNSGSARVELVVDECTARSDCDDGVYCNGAERCEGGWCRSGEPPECGDSFDCTEDQCDETANGCTHLPRDSLCDDGLACTGEERCTAEEGCIAGHRLCDDGLECTVDYCDEETTHCWSEPSHERCDDRVFCNGVEVCDPSSGCSGGTPACSDEVECTVDVCNEETESCAHLPDHEACNLEELCMTSWCSIWEGCVSEEDREGPEGAPSCEDGLDTDCDTLADGDDPDCHPFPCMDLTVASSETASADLVVDLCLPDVDPRFLWCESRRNRSELFSARFDSGDSELFLSGDAELAPDAQVPTRPGSAGLRICGGVSWAETPPIDTTGRNGLALVIAAANESLSVSEYMEVQISVDGGVDWDTLLIVGDGRAGTYAERTIILPSEAENRADVRLRLAIERALGCAIVDELVVVEIQPSAASVDIVDEGFEEGFGELLVFDPSGMDVSRVPSPTGVAALVAGGEGAWVGTALLRPLTTSSQRLVIELTLGASGLETDGYGLVQYSLDRGTSWTDVAGTGLGRDVRPLHVGAILWPPLEEEVYLRAISPSASLSPGDAGITIDDLVARAEVPAGVDFFGTFTAEEEGEYRTTLSTDLPGITSLRCFHRRDAYVQWTNQVVVAVTP